MSYITSNYNVNLMLSTLFLYNIYHAISISFFTSFCYIYTAVPRDPLEANAPLLSSKKKYIYININMYIYYNIVLLYMYIYLYLYILYIIYIIYRYTCNIYYIYNKQSQRSVCNRFYKL